MAFESRSPWQPDARWADPLIALLALLALLASLFTLRVRQQGALRPSERASLQARLMEVGLAGPGLLKGDRVPGAQWAKAEAQLKEPWDRALLAVLKAELDPGPGQGANSPERAAEGGPSGERFRRVYLAAYADGPLPDRGSREEVRLRLGKGYAAELLEARLQDREGGGGPLREQARKTLLLRVIQLGALGLLVVGLALGGAALGVYLLASRRKGALRPLPPWSMSGRGAVLVLLGWFLAFFASGNVVSMFLLPWPGLRWLAVPLGSLLHAAFGLQLLCWAEGQTPRALWRRLAPGPVAPDLAWGTAFLALAVLLVLAAAALSSLLLSPQPSPQRDLQELLRGVSGWVPNLLLFLTVAGLAPAFEELFFRGFLLPVLARRGPMALALAASALLFGAVHLQPAGLPILSTLGFAMALAMRHTGSLRVPILVHAAWNGSLFLLMRGFA